MSNSSVGDIYHCEARFVFDKSGSTFVLTELSLVLSQTVVKIDLTQNSDLMPVADSEGVCLRRLDVVYHWGSASIDVGYTVTQCDLDTKRTWP